jgi:hypothetical protein
MRERYEPPSDFLKAVIAEDAPLSGSRFGEANFQLLIDMTTDADRANRDWAVMLLSQQERDTPQVRDALLRAARDEDEDVRAEAILGLAMIDRALALPLVKDALAGTSATLPIFEAAALVAHPSLVNALRAFDEPSDDPLLDDLVIIALEACENGAPPVQGVEW